MGRFNNVHLPQLRSTSHRGGTLHSLPAALYAPRPIHLVHPHTRPGGMSTRRAAASTNETKTGAAHRHTHHPPTQSAMASLAISGLRAAEPPPGIWYRRSTAHNQLPPRAKTQGSTAGLYHSPQIQRGTNQANFSATTASTQSTTAGLHFNPQTQRGTNHAHPPARRASPVPTATQRTTTGNANCAHSTNHTLSY